MESSVRWQRATVLFEQRRWDMVIAELRQLLADEPEHVFANGLLARAFAEQGDLAAALQQAKHTVALAPDLAYAHDNLAEVWISQRKFASAVASAQRALELDPEDPGVYETIARAQFAQGNWHAALHAAEASLGLDPERTSCLNLRTLALANLGRTYAAHRSASAALAKAPGDAFAHQARAFVLLDAGHVESARRHFLEALRIDASLDGARDGLLDAMRRQIAWFRWMRAIGGLLPATEPPMHLVVIAVMLLRNAGPRVDDFLALLSAPFFLLVSVVVCVGSAMPLANVMLLAHPIGRHALARATAIWSIVVGAGFVVAICVCTIAWIDGSYASNHGWLFWGTIVMPFVGLHLMTRTWTDSTRWRGRRRSTRRGAGS